ncbi:MAG TPA: hypothetical protein VF737_06225 [Gemmatimonadaceae bacterium]
MHTALSRPRRIGLALSAVILALTAAAVPATARADHGTSGALGVRADRAVMSRSLMVALEKAHANIPAFSRQTGMACAACHYQFPALTPFGRLFKLNGYTLTGIATLTTPTDTSSNPDLKLLKIPPMAAMFVGDFAQTTKAVPGTQNGTVQFPDQASLFVGGAITPNLGIFSQFTYAAADGTFGMDNLDLRYAKTHEIGDHSLLFGMTLNNNPTVQDVWNTVPAWGFPFMGSEVVPAPAAGSVIDGALGQAVVGLGAYTLLDNKLYTEFDVYRSSPQGAALPLDASAQGAMSNVAPYWRVAWQQQMDQDYLMVGTFGMHAEMYPSGVTGLTNQFTDVGVDAQYEHPTGAGAVIGRASYIHESQNRVADFTAGASQQHDNLSTLRANVSLATSLRYGATLGYFQTTGTTDGTLYAANPVDGSASGSPNSSGFLGELDYNVWQNVRLGLQYTLYTKFNGAGSNYDGFGRSAGDNNTLYLFTWLAF